MRDDVCCRSIILLNKYNLEKSLRLIDRFDKVCIIEDHFDKKYLNKLKDILEYIGKKIEFVNSFNILENRQYFEIDPIWRYENNTNKKEIEKRYYSEFDFSCDYGKILQYIASQFDEGNTSYRRLKINKYFKDNGWNPDTIFSNTDNETYLKMLFDKKYDYIYISHPSSSAILCAKSRLDGSVLIYDRTDNWSSMSENQAFEEKRFYIEAKYLFTSAKYLYDSIPENERKKAKFVPNGTTLRPYRKVEKYKRKTAVYAGRQPMKIDFDRFIKLAKENPDWDIKLYGLINLNYWFDKLYNRDFLPKNFYFVDRVSEDELHDILLKSHVGLIFFKDIEWVEGMLPLKVFNYCNAHIPTAYQNCPEIVDYPMCFDINKYTLDEILEKSPNDEEYEIINQQSDWNKKFDYITNVFTGKIKNDL